MPGKIRIVIVDDHEVVRHGLRLSLEAEPDMVVDGEARTGAEAIEVAQRTQPDVLLLDVRLEDMDGPEVCRHVREVAPRTAVVMLTNYLQDDLVLRSLVAGAKGYVIKDIELGELKKMIRAVHRGHSVLDPRVTSPVISTVADRAGLGETEPTSTRAAGHLSETDLAILRHLAQGLTNKEIATRIHLSPYTVKDHLEKMCALLNVKSRAGLVGEASRRGLI